MPYFLGFGSVLLAFPGICEVGLVNKCKRVPGANGVEGNKVLEFYLRLLNGKANDSEHSNNSGGTRSLRSHAIPSGMNEEPKVV